jgi:hypothetical protein
MKKSTRDNTKIVPRKRPPVTGMLIGVRLQPPSLERVDAWAARQDDRPSRPEAMRRLIELGLASGRTIPVFRASEAAPEPTLGARKRR